MRLNNAIHRPNFIPNKMQRIIVTVSFKPNGYIPNTKHVVRARNVYTLNRILRQTRESIKKSIRLQRVQLYQNKIFLHVPLHLKIHQIKMGENALKHV